MSSLALGSGTKDRALKVAPECRLAICADVHSGTAMRIDLVALQHPYPLRGCNSDLAQYSNTPSLRAAGFEDEDDDEDENEAPCEGELLLSRMSRSSSLPTPGICEDNSCV
jgi:hypothetical protein